MRQQIRQQLEQLSEPDYRAFNEKLLPGVSNMLGVRLPKLRTMAKRTAKSDAQAYLSEMKTVDWQKNAYYEEKMLYGLVIGYAKMDDNQYREQLDAFVPLIDNWGVCDSCCMTYQWMRKQPAFWWEYLNRWIEAGTEFGARFGYVSLLDHFVDASYIRKIFSVCGRADEEGYYAKMAKAWLISMCFVKFPEETYAFLQENRMDDFTHHKSIQKICESYRVTKEWKAFVRKLRRDENK